MVVQNNRRAWACAHRTCPVCEDDERESARMVERPQRQDQKRKSDRLPYALLPSLEVVPNQMVESIAAYGLVSVGDDFVHAFAVRLTIA